MKPDDKTPVIKPLNEEDLITTVEGITEPATNSVEFFKKLNTDQQDEILRMILTEGGLGRLMSAIQDVTTPGAFDIFLDQVQYYHFFPSVREDSTKEFRGPLDETQTNNGF